MLLQALLSIAFITILAGALLTSAFVDVKVASHQTLTKLASTALGKGTDEFINWAQIYVARHGASAAWPAATVSDAPEPICSPPPSAGNGAAATSQCNSFVTISYAVVGESAASATGSDVAQNLQAALNENRIAGTVTATITDRSGNVESSHTRMLTARVFDAPPFAILSGARDATTMANSIQSAQGDTAGYRDIRVVNYRATPDPK
ncbi:MAG: hypothetical protein IAI49_07625, partial [Candidatus Eremiobacteraeota bacterium]|nr:hypothetical protein [Candidatus Eremiobacteraeota bacterium]